jgi:5-methylcytosine-specific restriction endonuclease McrA
MSGAPLVKPARRGPKPRKRIRTRRPAGTVRREAKAAGYVDPDTWEAILAWYGYACAYCDEWRWLQQDHVIPISKGGKHSAANVVPACVECNMRKGTQTWEPKRRHPWMEEK